EEGKWVVAWVKSTGENGLDKMGEELGKAMEGAVSDSPATATPVDTTK
ncbi:MAG: hypothetical protein RLZZ165_229, partial [Bacteroidota bacterium]